jgi:type I restriction-modification system DNA methylase subunit
MTGAWVYCELPNMIASAPKLNRIESSLKSLTDTRSLKELFYDRLHYDRVSEPISTRRFSDSVRASLGDSEPLLLANGGVGGQFKVIYTRLSSQQIYKQEQRGIIESLLGIHPHSLFVFSNQGQDDWHFINAKHDEKNTQRRLLRRIVVNQREQLRTAIEQIGELDLQAIGQGCGKKAIELEPLEIQIQHDEAFDVEKVTDRFFSQYKLVFESVEGSIEGIRDAEQKRLFTQKLFNRLMFIAFVQKKGWLEFNGSGDYFKALWQDYKKAKSQPLGNFYRDRLSHLFFEGLNDPDKQGDKKLIKLIGNVPYLNGGLFEEDVSETVTEIVVPDEAIKKILEDLFEKFNFTVSESTPLDVDVAVDPEMLGKVFEESVTNRDGSGSYYTPKPIVSFMCRETLKGYLKSKCDADAEAIDLFVDSHNPKDLTERDRKAIEIALKAITVCDPACGSGAYLLGMMHELLGLQECLFPSDSQESESVHARKLSIIKNNLYGVDREEFAVNIARLRLWLSLSVDGDKPQALPNLNYKVEAGDSLTAPVIANQRSARDVLVKEFQKLKSEFLTAHGQAKKASLKKEIDRIKEQIALFTHGSNKVNGFDWVVEFAEVMADGGFDLVIANPPYGATVEDKVRDLYFERKPKESQSKDTYGLFMARGLQLLKPGGKLSYIVSDTWRTIQSHRPLRKRLLAETTIEHIIDLPGWIFKATVNTCIFTATKNIAGKEHELITADLRNLKNGDWISLVLNLDAVADRSVDLQPLNYARYTYPQSLISTHEHIPFFIASPSIYKSMNDKRFVQFGNIADVKQGVATTDNEYYLRKRLDARGSYQILDEYKLLTYEDISQFNDDEKRNGVNPNKFGGRHFLPYDKGGESDTGEGWLPNYYVPTQYFIDWSMNAVSRLHTATIADVKMRKCKLEKINNGDSDKISAVIRNPQYFFKRGLTFSMTGVYAPTFRENSRTLFDVKGSSIFSDVISPNVLLAILSSKTVKYIIKTLINNGIETTIDGVKKLMIPPINKSLSGKISKLTDKIIGNQKQDLRYPYYLHEQRELDNLIYNLYGLSDEDIREIELWYCRRYSKLAEAQGEIDAVKEKYHDYLSQCDSLADSRTRKQDFIVTTPAKNEKVCTLLNKSVKYSDRLISPEDLN